MTAPDAETLYDKVLYPSYTRIQTHPDRLATIGRLLGMKPASVEDCRVLELGCGNGSNLVPIAYGLPRSEFVGVDLAAKPIAVANQMVRDLALKNTAFHNRSITEVGREFGDFDYIICHGVFSWVPEEVRQSILRVCHESLKPGGIAFVSYNAYPGNHLREMIREMLLFHTRGFADPQEQITQARALAEFVAAAQDDKDLYRKFLKLEMELFLRHNANYAFHDSLAEINSPYYFFHFMEAAHAHHLKYLGEADFHTMLDVSLPKGVTEKLDELAGDRIAREQYLDFLRCRQFRQTLLCHEEVQLDLSLKPAAIAEFYVAAFVKCLSETPQPFARILEKFENREGARIQTDSPLAKTALAILTEEWPQAIAFSELSRRVREKLLASGWRSEHERREEFELQAVLFRSFCSGLIHLHTYSPAVFRELTVRPVASPLARWQVQHANFVTTLFHGAIVIEDELARELVRLLDGTRDRATLLQDLESFLNQRRKAAGAEGQDFSQDEKARALLAEALDGNLAKLARMGLLAG